MESSDPSESMKVSPRPALERLSESWLVTFLLMKIGA